MNTVSRMKGNSPKITFSRKNLTEYKKCANTFSPFPWFLNQILRFGVLFQKKRLYNWVFFDATVFLVFAFA